MRTYVNLQVLDYLSQRYNSHPLLRTAVFPFDVPETFAPPGNKSLHFGRDIAQSFQRELLRSEELGIVELFDRDRWPGKRQEFNAGAYQAIEMARHAGYDLLVIGYMDYITNETEMTFFTRLIDTSNSLTIWYGKTVVYSNERVRQRELSKVPLIGAKETPSLFHFPERTELFVTCTVNRIFSDDMLSGDEPANQPGNTDAKSGTSKRRRPPPR